MTENDKWNYIKDLLDRIERQQNLYNIDNNKSHDCIRKQVISLREEMAGNRVRWKATVASFGIFITVITGWLVSHFSKN